MQLPALVALAVGSAACVTDLRSRRIPNVLTFGAAASAVVSHAIVQGIDGLSLALGGWAVGTALFLPFFALGGLGGGDVKLLGALGAWLGPGDAVWLALYSSMAGGGVALIVALHHGYLRTALRNIGNLLQFWWLVGPRPMPQATLEDSGSPRLAYAVPIFMGTVATLWLQ
jgi:prepilin peptidase CpaA